MVTCEEAVTILAESKRQNEIMRDNPSVFFTHGDLKGPQNARKRIEALDMAIFELKGNSRRIELDYLLAFATESCFDTETCCDQLRSLWTAYCLHNRLDVDTRDYDLTLLKVWEVVSAEEEDNAYWTPSTASTTSCAPGWCREARL